MRLRTRRAVAAVMMASLAAGGCQGSSVEPEAALLAGLAEAGWQGWDSVRVIAHRGFRCCFPENTFEAIEGAVGAGAGAVELDVGFTRDGVAVLLHDETVDRTTNRTGSLAQMSWEEVSTLDACPDAPSPCAVPGAVKALSFTRGRIRVVLDIKGMGHTRFFDRLAAGVRTYDVVEEVAIISYDLHVLSRARREFPEMPLGFYYNYNGGLSAPDSVGALESAVSLGRVELFLRRAEMQRGAASFERATALGVPISTYPARDEVELDDLLGTPIVRRVLSDVPGR